MEVGLKETIDRRIKEASDMLVTARKTENLDKELRRPVRELIRVCDRLLEIVTDQQIEMLRLRRDVDAKSDPRSEVKRMKDAVMVSAARRAKR